MVQKARLHAGPGDRAEQECEGEQGHAAQFGPSEVQLSSTVNFLYFFLSCFSLSSDC